MSKVIKCKYETLLKDIPGLGNLGRGEVNKGQTISVREGAGIKFYVDGTCFDDAVVSRETKWAFIYEQFYEQSDKNQYNALWADISAGSASARNPEQAPDVGELFAKKDINEPVAIKGIGTQYKKGTEFTISPTGANFYYGFKQRVVLFTTNLEEEFYFFVIPYTNPSITYAYFEKNLQPFRFGEIVSLSICLHQYPGYVNAGQNYVADVYLIDKDNAGKIKANTEKVAELVSLASELENFDLFKDKHKKIRVSASTNSSNTNTYININFLLELDWRDFSRMQRYFAPVVEIFAIEKGLIIDSKKIVERRNFFETPTTILQQYDRKLINVADVETYKNQPNSEILVEYETTSEILGRMEFEKKQMIQYIGDIDYRRKEVNPCAYSIISVKEKKEKAKEEKVVVIFDEHRLQGVDDKTETSIFSIISGEEKKKEVTVTAKFKKDASSIEESMHIGGSYKCDQILNDGRNHSGSSEVFKMKWIVGQMKPSKNGSFFIENFLDHHRLVLFAPNNAFKAGFLNSAKNKEYKDDQEAKGVPVAEDIQSKYQAVSVAGVQGLTEDDYTIEGDSIILKLRYQYNRTYESTLMKLLGYTIDLAYSESQIWPKQIAWVARYIFLRTKYKQTYFVPVSTCRYPNQIAMINLYPDIEWWINAAYKTEKPIYVRQAPNYNERLFTSWESQNEDTKKKREEGKAENGKLSKKKYQLSFEAKFKVDGKEYELLPGDGFPLLNAINFFLRAYEVFKQLSFVDETSEREKAIADGTAKTYEGKAPEKKMTTRWSERSSKGLPFKIEVTLPSFSGGVYGKFAQSKCYTNVVGSFVQLKFAAKPLFGISGKLDLLYFAQFIGPIGQAMHQISRVVKRINYLTFGAVRIDYFLYVGASVNFDIDISTVEYHSADGWDGGELQAVIPLALWIEAGVDINASIQGVGSVSAEGKIKGEAIFETRLTYDKRNNKCPGLLEFGGLKAKIWLKFSVKDDEVKTSGEPEKKADYVKSIIDPKDPWKIEIL